MHTKPGAPRLSLSAEPRTEVSSERGSKYTLGSLLDAAVPIASRRRKKAPETRQIRSLKLKLRLNRW